MASLASIVKKHKAKIGLIHKASCLELNTRIVEGTPRDTGIARASWTPDGSLRIGQPYKFVSTLKYMHSLEYGVDGVVYDDGREAHSPQAPNGMLRINVRNWGDIVRGKANEL